MQPSTHLFASCALGSDPLASVCVMACTFSSYTDLQTCRMMKQQACLALMDTWTQACASPANCAHSTSFMQKSLWTCTLLSCRCLSCEDKLVCHFGTGIIWMETVFFKGVIMLRQHRGDSRVHTHFKLPGEPSNILPSMVTWKNVAPPLTFVVQMSIQESA